MLPPDGIVRAARRWMLLLKASTFRQASAIILADSRYTDLSLTQYTTALDWLTHLKLVHTTQSAPALVPAVSSLSDLQLSQLLFERTLEEWTPPWLPDADLLIPDATDFPLDAASLATVLGLTQEAALVSIRRAQCKVDVQWRARIGAAGERALVELLERRWNGSTTHVSLLDDSFGYDVILRLNDGEWHLEIKTTTRRGRLAVFLSRHEHEVGRQDPRWRLLIVGLNDQLQLAALATVREAVILDRAPLDRIPESTWETVCHQVHAADLLPGLSFIDTPDATPRTLDFRFLHCGGIEPVPSFAWMPLVEEPRAAAP